MIYTVAVILVQPLPYTPSVPEFGGATQLIAPPCDMRYYNALLRSDNSGEHKST